MKEAFLHYVWKNKLFEFRNLKTTDSTPIRIEHVGYHNKDAGPDFLDARIQMDDKLWAGNVEIHKRASDWERHDHHQDPDFQNIILHVVYEDDKSVKTAQGAPLPTLELHSRVDKDLYDRYLHLVENNEWIPCQSQIHSVKEIHINTWLERLLVERLERKTNQIFRDLEQTEYNWEETFYHFLARYFGMNVNAEPFEALAHSLPLKVLAKHKRNLTEVEALLFGQSGMLEKGWEDDYPRTLKEEYDFLRQKYQLEPLQPQSWKFMRLRPSNFPTIRIAQFAALIHESSHLFSKIIENPDRKALQKLLQVTASDYWTTHYQFDKKSKKQKKTLGRSAIQILLINAIAPFLFIYGKHKGNSGLQDNALELLRQIPAEKNSIIRQWKKLEMNPQSAFDTQALLQLKNEYCNRQRCLECTIGNQILQR